MKDNQSTPEGTENQEVQLSPTEQEALASGWVPKDQFHGEADKWVDAAEFLRRGELFRKIETQSRELKDVKRALQDMKKLHADVRQVEYQRALETLKAQKKTALEEGDAEAVIAADERIDLVREQQRLLAQQEANEPAQSGEAHPEFVQWVQQNSWYSNSAPMRAFADTLGQELHASGLSPVEVLKKVAQEVRKEFPHKFKNPNQDRPGAVEGTTAKGSSSSSKFQLTPEQRQIMNRFVRTGALTEEEYIRDLKKTMGM